MRKLNPFENWMVLQQLDYVKIHGIVKVLENLHFQGYHRIADEVRRLYNNE